MKQTQQAKQTHPDRTKGFQQFAIGMIAYVVIVVAIGFLDDPQALEPVFGILLALLPMAVAIWAMAGWLKAVRTFDELQQKIFSECGLIALGLTAVVTFTYGFLETLIGLPRVSMFVVFPFIAATFALAQPFVRRRYA